MKIVSGFPYIFLDSRETDRGGLDISMQFDVIVSSREYNITCKYPLHACFDQQCYLHLHST